MPEYDVELKGGYQAYISSYPVQDIPINAFSEMQNCFVFNGRLKKRPGFYYFSTASTLSQLTGHVEEFIATRGAMTSKYIVQIGATASFFFNPMTASHSYNFTIITTGCSPIVVDVGELNFGAFSLISFANLGYKFYVDASNVVKSFPIGLPAPAGTPTLSYLAGGTGTWSAAMWVYYKITWVTDNGYEFTEGNPSNPSSQTSAGNQTKAFRVVRPAITSGYTNITHWRLYRLCDGIDTTYKLLATQAIGFNTIDDAGDTPNPASSDEIAIDHGQVPENPTCLGYHGDRLWVGAASGKLYYSKVNSPAGSCQYFSGFRYFQVGSATERFIKFISFPNFLLVIKQYSMWAIEGTSVSTFRLQKIMNMGAFGTRGIIFHNGYLYFINEQGIWKTNLFDTPKNIALSIWPEFLLIQNNFGSFWVNGARSIFDPFTQCIWFHIGLATEPQTLLYHPEKEMFVGKFNLAIFLNPFVLNKIASKITLGFSDSIGRLYFNNTSLFGTYSYSSEDNFTVSATSGMVVPETNQFQKRVFRHIQLFSNLAADTVTTNTTETVTLQTAINSSMTHSCSISVNFGGATGTFKTLGVGRSDRGLSLKILKTGASPGITWELGNMKYVYETIGKW